MQQPDPIRVLIVDDHAVVRRGVRAFLETQPDIEVVGEAASGQEAVRQVMHLAPDVVLLDLIMPGMDGITTLREIKRLSPRTQVVVLTSFDSDEHIFPAIRAGALSYLLKDVSPEHLAQTIRMAARGEAHLHPRVAARLMQEARRPQATAAGYPFADLTERELEVLRLLAQGLTNPEIAQHLHISTRTVKFHISNILSKLHLADRTQAAIYAWRHGLMQDTPPQRPSQPH